MMLGLSLAAWDRQVVRVKLMQILLSKDMLIIGCVVINQHREKPMATYFLPIVDFVAQYAHRPVVSLLNDPR